MIDVTTEIIIKAPANKVAEYASNPDNAPEWYKNIKSVEWETPRPLSIGSRIAFKAKFLGKELAYIYEITRFIPGKILVMKTSEGPFPMETTYNWESIDEKTCRMLLRNAGNPSGFSKLFSPFMKSAMRKANKKDLQLLKSITENKFN